jgi:hypothetical protein
MSVKEYGYSQEATHSAPAHGRAAQLHAARHLAVFAVHAAHGRCVALRAAAVAAEILSKAADLVLATTAAVNTWGVVTPQCSTLAKGVVYLPGRDEGRGGQL